MAVHMTSWHRLEPVPRTDNLDLGLSATIADPLWMMGRQWQFNEFEGEDAGSPVEAVFDARSSIVSRFHPGPTAGSSQAEITRRATTIDLAAEPMESVVERSPIGRGRGAAQLSVAAGRHFVRLLRANRATDQISRFVKEFAITDGQVDFGPDGPGSAAVQSWAQSVVGRVPDGRKLAAALRRHQPSGELTDLPADLGVPATRQAALIATANQFLAWYENGIGSMISETAAPAWQPRRLEYAFSAQAGTADGNRSGVKVENYTGGNLDWYHFDTDDVTALGYPRPAQPERQIRRRLLPSRVFYAGMPAERFWEFEDATVSFGGLRSGQTDLARILLTEFALSFGNDWFVIPVDLPVGSLCEVDNFVVRDTFGVETKVDRSRSANWSMFELADGKTGQPSNQFFLPPTIHSRLQSEAIEEVALSRDEMANVVWAIERSVTGDHGRPIDQYREAQVALALGASQHIDGDIDDAELIYRLASYVPENWHPLVPVQADPGTPGVIELELRGIRRLEPGGASSVVAPRSSILNAADPMVIEEEEIDRTGVVAKRGWELCRWLDGRYWLWNAHHIESGRGEASSGLSFDTSNPTSVR